MRPKSRATVRFSLAVPDGTPPGSYLGSLVTALCTPAVSGQVNTETRIARLVQLTVPGTGGGSTHTVPLTPTGIYVIPGGSATITGRLAALPALGRRAVTASVTATVPGGAAKTVESNTVRLSCFPWLVAALTAGGLLALSLVLIVTRKRWRAWLRRRAEERTALRALKRELRATRCRPGRGSAGARSLRSSGRTRWGSGRSAS
ncbi:hypothetical protein [Streptomyces goshikiensis]|uniref:hypothetical protein n=1 Tax=Streptomyces goshikiensis TaxID=1942 RepID=UPI0037FA292A